MANYLYNGVELPAVPELDGYPYVIILKRQNEQYMAIFSTSGFAYAGAYILQDNNGTAVNPIYTIPVGADMSTEKWVDTNNSNSYGGYNIESRSNIIWSNHDITYKTGGGVFFAASEPIPVPTAEPIDPQSLTAGWLVGKKILTMRGNVCAPKEEL